MKNRLLLAALLAAAPAPSLATNHARPNQPSTTQVAAPTPATVDVTIAAAGVDLPATAALPTATPEIAAPPDAVPGTPGPQLVENSGVRLEAAPPGLALPLVGPIQISAVSPQPAAPEPVGDDDGPAITAERLDESLHPLRGHPNRLGAHIRSLAAAFHLLEEANRPDVPAGDRWASAVLKGVQSDLEAMSGMVQLPDAAVYEHILTESGSALSEIARNINSGATNMSRRLRLSPSDPPVPVSKEPIKFVFYPMAGDPFQWGHLISPMRAVAGFRRSTEERHPLDLAVYSLAWNDPIRKPHLTEAELRYHMGEQVISLLAPLFAHSQIARDTNFDGERNLFRLLALNYEQPIIAYYLVGDDHYKLVDRHGLPDTLPKLEANLKDLSLGHNPDIHQVRVLFIDREGNLKPVPTSLDVSFIPHVGFEVASSMIRQQGAYFLMPRIAYQMARALRLYGLNPQ